MKITKLTLSSLLFFLLIARASQAQPQLLDSLQSIESDTARLTYLTNFINKNLYSDPIASTYNVNLYDSIASKLNNPKYKAQSLTLKGMAYYVNKQYEQSINYYIDALQLKDYFPNKTNVARLYNNLATTYQVRGDLENSIKYFYEALSLYRTENDSLWIANVSSNLGLLLVNNEQFSEAEPMVGAALDYFKRKGLTINEGYTLLTLANLQNQTGQHEQSIKTYKNSVSLVPETVNPIVSMAALSGIGVAYNRLGNYQKAEPYLLRGLEKSIAFQQIEQTKECHRELSDLYEKQNKFAQSLKHHKEYTTAKDSMFTLEQDAKMVEALTKYEATAREQEIALLNSEQEIASAKLTGSRRLSLVMGSGLLILCSLLFWLYKLNQENKKSAKEKDTLLREIHHRVKNNLQVISALLTLQTKYVKDNLAIEALREGQDRVQSMALIHTDLYQHNNLKGVNTKVYLEKLIANLLESYQISKDDIVLDLDIQSLWLDVDTMIPMGLLINELVSNALKHAFKDRTDGILKISLIESNGVLHLEVADNGHGVSKDASLQTATFGQSLIKSFAQKLKADISYKDDNGLSIKMDIKEYHKAA